MEKPIFEPRLLILGGGPAGLTAAIYAARANLDVTLLETVLPGGQMRDTNAIENYPGFKSIDGPDLSALMAEQAKELGAEVINFSRISGLSLETGNMFAETKKAVYKPAAIIIATGAAPKLLPIPNEAAFHGNGIHYCATCDGAMYGGAVVGVVGGGDAALEEALFLTNYATKVVIIRRYDYFRGAAATLDKVLTNPRIEILYNRDLIGVEGEEALTAALVKNTETGKEERIELSAIFASIGTEPRTQLFKDSLTLDDFGYIVTDEGMRTSLPGVFAAGDVRQKAVRQITTAVADGTIAALNAEKYIRQGI